MKQSFSAWMSKFAVNKAPDMRTLKILSLICIAVSISGITMGFAFHANTPATLSWLTMEEAQQKSMEDGKPLFVFVEAEWCGICKRMLQNVIESANP
ncbi:thioredoxin family protein [Rhodohalobacter sp. 8-1]|uniref:thioredoxin family protein n=1 Tax=Rhodohalobacter sp. 8-1 TaxID=3131972 RepID=UPI0030ED4422